MNDAVSLARWREWARFVFLDRDQGARTDEELRELVCAAWDAEARSHAKLNELLSRTCDALKGKHPDPMRLHSFHDLPEVAQRLRAENAELRQQAVRVDRFDCPECGQGVGVDESGCCRTCGRDATIRSQP